MENGNRIPWSKWRWLVVVGLLLGVFIYAVIRDLQFEKTYCGDLRCRVLGARIIKDGGSPYFYKWRPEDGMRYYDPENFNNNEISNTTGSPMISHLFSPLVEWPEATISKVWLGLEYAMLLAMAVFAFLRAPTVAGKQTVLLVLSLALLTNAWKGEVDLGQTYICIPFFALLFLLFAEKEGHPVRGFLAGVAACCLVLIRVNAVFFFLPFFFVVYRYSRKWLFYFGLAVLLFACWLAGSRHERTIWKDYYRYVTEAFRTQHGLATEYQVNAPDPHYPVWEGIDTMAAYQASLHPPARVYSENGNAFVVYEKIFHRKMSIPMMTILSVVLIAGSFLFFYWRTRPLQTPDVHRSVLAGFVLLMIPDILSPVLRHQYYTVQWFLPLMLAAAYVSTRQKLYYGLLLIGLLLNCFHLSFLPMQNTLGEYLILGVLLMLSCVPEKKAVTA